MPSAERHARATRNAPDAGRAGRVACIVQEWPVPVAQRLRTMSTTTSESEISPHFVSADGEIAIVYT